MYGNDIDKIYQEVIFIGLSVCLSSKVTAGTEHYKRNSFGLIFAYFLPIEPSSSLRVITSREFHQLTKNASSSHAHEKHYTARVELFR